MIAAAEPSGLASEKPPVAGGVIRGLLSRDGWAMLAAVVATMIVEWGVFLTGRCCGVVFRESLLAALAATALWLAIGPGCFGAGASSALSAFIRGGIVADATAINLLGFWLLSLGGGDFGGLGFVGVVKVYCVCASMAVLGVAVVCLARRWVWRACLAVTCGLVLVVAMASPLWISAWIGGTSSPATQELVTWAVRINPFYAIADAVVEETGFVWHSWGLMYDWSRVGEYVNPAGGGWWQTCLLYLLAAGGCGVVSLLRYRVWPPKP
ncbi:MAG: hypothetical protein K8S55_04545 [Phycisphaerae bacterium]|nr:hypothetical protein [Phycisphaerae bacterium]